MKKCKFTIICLFCIAIIIWSCPVNAVSDNSFLFKLSHNSLSITTFGLEDNNESDSFNAKATIEIVDDYNYSSELNDINALTYIDIPLVMRQDEMLCEYNLPFKEDEYIESGHMYKVSLINLDTGELLTSQKIKFVHELSVDRYNCSFGLTGSTVNVDEDCDSVALVINKTEYKVETNNNHHVVIKYPLQKEGEKAKCIVSDKFGCSYEFSVFLRDELQEADFCQYISEESIKPTNTLASCTTDYSNSFLKMNIKINDVVYSSDYISLQNYDMFHNFSVSYPEMPVDTPVEIWFETENGAASEVYYGKIYNKKIDIDVFDVTYEGLLGSANTSIQEAYVTINDKRYNCKIDSGNHFSVKYKALANDKVILYLIDTEGYKHKREYTVPKSNGKIKTTVTTCYTTCWTFKSKTSDIDSSYLIVNGHRYKAKVDYDDFDGSDEYYSESYYVKYNEKVNSKGTVYVKTKDGGVYTKTVVLQGVKPRLYVNKVYAGDKIIKGSTKGNSTVTIKIGKKTYKTKSNEEGDFKIKTKGYKYKTKIKVKVKTLTGCVNNKTITVKKVYGDISIVNTIYKGTKTARVRITNARKGDSIRLYFGNKTITKKIKKSCKKKTFVIKLSGLIAGKTVNADYRDKYKTLKSSTSKRIYYGDSIYVGMSAKNAQLTTWGYPVRRNDYSWNLQWVYESGGSTLYVYIKNGVVTNIQRMNY